MKTNGKIPIEIPRKKYLDEKENRRNMESILFNNKIIRLSVKQCLYILNEKNWNINLQNFRMGFNELNKEDIIFDDNSIFNEYNEIINLENFDEISKIFITTSDYFVEPNNLADIFIEDIENEENITGILRE